VSQSPAQILKQYWGYDKFRPLQHDIITSIRDGKDTLALLPTGGGKSVCYQVPALINDGLCLVISPLIALMQDQVQRLRELNIPAACLHAGMHYSNVKQVLDNTLNDAYKLLYISPERLQTQLFKDYLLDLNVTMIAVDEAHCISQWGHDFRPAYLKIAEVKEIFPDVPILALTASATTEVQKDIIKQLQLKDTAVFRQSFERSNIFYSINYTENKNAGVVANINGSCSIIYCRSRKQTEAISKFLSQSGIAATAYHAGMNKDKRESAQNEWMQNEVPVMAATTAFGMGIDKPDVRMVLHYDAPEHLEAYYQEAGRAGRDGAPSKALALYNSMDIKRLEESTALQYPPEAYLREVYQAVVEYLQVPIATEPDHYYPFELNDFCQKFDLMPNQAVYALKLLEREGLWTISDAVYHPATIQFVTDRHTLDDLQVTNPRLGYITVGLLRMYGTVFHFPTSIRLFPIAKQLRLQQDDIEQALQQLHGMGILEYNKPGEGPQLFFHHYRVDSRHLIIDLNRINLLRKQHEARTTAMISFLENKIACRERLLLTYFGEHPTKDCGHCDVCYDRQHHQITDKDLKAQLLDTIQQAQSIPVQMLVAPYPTAIKEQAMSLLRELIDDGVLLIKENCLSFKR